jgi:hypothetical protein
LSVPLISPLLVLIGGDAPTTVTVSATLAGLSWKSAT